MDCYIYRHTNKENGKSYIGQTRNIKSRWREDSYKTSTKFYRAIQKYGWDNFTHEIIHICDETNVDERERYFIEKYDSVNNGYNLESGGYANKKMNAESIAKRSDTVRKQYASGERVSYMKGKEPWNKGKKMSVELREKLSIAHIGKQAGHIVTEETKEKIRQANLGRIVSEETRKKLSESHKGKPSARKGKKASEETRQKLRASHLGKIPSEETREKLRLSLKGIPQRKRTDVERDKQGTKVINITTGEVFASLVRAKEKYNIPKSNIHKVCNGERKTAGGFEWAYYTEQKSITKN